MNSLTKKIAVGAIISAIYVVLTFFFTFSSYGLIQFRVSEALTVLPAMTPVAIPGLFVGCLISNIYGFAIGQTSMIDIICGSLASLIAAYLSYKLRDRKWLVPLPPVIVNALIIGAQLHLTLFPGVPMLLCMAYVFIGQAVVCYCLGMPLLLYISKEVGGKKTWDRWTQSNN